jgi:hypothetical protein
MPELPISGLSTIGTQGVNDYFPVVEFASGITKKESRSQFLSSLGLSSYLPLAGGTMTGDITFADTKSIKKGTAFFKFNGSNVEIVAPSGTVKIQETTGNILLGNSAGSITAASKFLTDATNGAVKIKRGSAADTDNVIEFLNGSGTTKSCIDGNGRMWLGDPTLGVAGGARLITYRDGVPGHTTSYGNVFYTSMNTGASAVDTGIHSWVVNNATSLNASKMVGFKSTVNMHDVGGVSNVTALAVGYESVFQLEYTNQTITNGVHFLPGNGTNGGTFTNEYVLKLENSYLKGTNKWFLYNDDATVNSYLKGNVTIEGKIIASTGYSATKVLGLSGVQVSHTGNTTETTLYTLSIPSGIMGANSVLRISYLSNCTNSGNNKTVRIKIGGTSFSSVVLTTAAGSAKTISIYNRGVVNSQVYLISTNTFGGGSIGSTTASVDFSSTQSLTFTAELGNSGETISLEGITVEVINPGI